MTWNDNSNWLLDKQTNNLEQNNPDFRLGTSTDPTTPTTQPIPTTNTNSSFGSGWTPEQVNTGSQIAGSAAQLGATVAQGLLATNEADKARAENAQLAGIMRNDTLKQQAIQNQQAQQSAQLERDSFNVQKKIDSATIQYNDFMSEIQNLLNNRNKVVGAANRLNQLVANDDEVKKQIINMWGK
jgi:hypothetical protein